MLFLLNTMIVEVAVPEMHLRQRWRAMGCGEPTELRAQDAIDFVTKRIVAARKAGVAIDAETAKDLSALVVAKTGANSLMLKPTAGGGVEPRLRDLPHMVLETYRRGAANDTKSVVRLRADA
ncbi:MAG: hypothetical protein AAGA24_04515 [Pseudomonadota bacterium]